MDRLFGKRLAVLLTVLVAAGCGDNTPPEQANNADKPNATPPATAAAANDPAALAVREFFDAVIKGDAQRASSQFTPAAMQQIVNSKKQFAPQGLENASFRIHDVRKPAESHAIVQCFVTVSGPSGKSEEEEICCLVRLVDNAWRISGMAYRGGPNGEQVLEDFESGRTITLPSGGNMAQGSQSASSRPSPRTAQESPPQTVR